MTLLAALQNINAYWVPLRTIEVVAMSRGLNPGDDIDRGMLESKAFNLCKADLLKWLSQQPDVSQGGQSYSFTDEQRKRLKAEADSIYELLEPQRISGVRYGYKGDRL